MKQARLKSVLTSVSIAIAIETFYLYVSRKFYWSFEGYQYDSHVLVAVSIFIGTWILCVMQDSLVKRIETALITIGAFFLFYWIYALMFLCSVIGDCL